MVDVTASITIMAPVSSRTPIHKARGRSNSSASKQWKASVKQACLQRLRQNRLESVSKVLADARMEGIEQQSSLEEDEWIRLEQEILQEWEQERAQEQEQEEEELLHRIAQQGEAMIDVRWHQACQAHAAYCPHPLRAQPPNLAVCNVCQSVLTL